MNQNVTFQSFQLTNIDHPMLIDQVSCMRMRGVTSEPIANV